MKIKSFVTGAAIALITGVGSVSADKLYVADTANDTSTPFAMLDGIAAGQMSVQDMAATRGLALSGGTASFLAGGEFSIDVSQDNSRPVSLLRESGFVNVWTAD